MSLTLQREISLMKKIPRIGAILAVGLQRIEDAVNSVATNSATAAMATLPAPPTIQGLTVKASGGLVHAVISDSSNVRRGINYFVEYSNNASFQGRWVQHLGPSRTMQPIILPAKQDGGAAQNWYFRAYSQYPGGAPGQPVHFGGSSPAAVSVGGSTQFTLIPSTGSGTGSAATNEQSTPEGFGTVLHRL
jgi:hypothetical protein